MKRREFLYGVGAGLGTLGLSACNGLDPRRDTGAIADIELRPSIRGTGVGPGYVGLSYESALLADPQFLSGDNAALVALIRGIGAQGTIRIGGNSSEYAQWSADGSAPVAPLRHAVTPEAIQRLAALLQATGWRAVYGLNLGHGDPARAAAEAAYVAQALGDRLEAFQIGNEPDLYVRAGLRPQGYDVGAFVDEWQRYATAIRAAAGDVPLAGPDVAYTAEWIEAFAQRCGSQVLFLSDHYYPVGPPSNPQADILALFRSEIDRYPRLRNGAERVRASGKPLRITEGNSCWDGGKPGLSDTMASALWAVNLMFNCARDGIQGFCFHGGAAGPYSPIVRNRDNTLSARPLYYGMRFFGAAGSGTLMETRVNSLNRGLRAYALQRPDNGVNLVILNLGQAQATDVRIAAPGRKFSGGSVLRLAAPTLFATNQVALGGAYADASGQLAAREEPLAVDADGTGLVTVSSAGAVLLKFA